jgi:hypothetical protein
MSSSTNGVISAHEVYTLDEAARRMGLSYWGIRKARIAGLRMIKSGKRQYVRGSDIIAFLDQRGGQQQDVAVAAG